MSFTKVKNLKKMNDKSFKQTNCFAIAYAKIIFLKNLKLRNNESRSYYNYLHFNWVTQYEKLCMKNITWAVKCMHAKCKAVLKLTTLGNKNVRLYSIISHNQKYCLSGVKEF